MSQFRNLAFEGGGVKGIAYAGAIRELENHHNTFDQTNVNILDGIRRVTGTSAGAITATLLALGATSREVEQIVSGTRFRAFMDDSWGLIRDTNRLITEYGWYKGDEFSGWIRKQVAALVGDAEITFAQLQARIHQHGTRSARRLRELSITGSDLTLQMAQVYSAQSTPDLPIWLAARMSMSIPLFFACVRRDGDVIVDGGVSWNYPIDMFDDRASLSDHTNASVFIDPKRYRDPATGEDKSYPTVYDDSHVFNKETLGFRVDTADEIKVEMNNWSSPPVVINDIKDYAVALLTFLLNSANKAHLHANDWSRTVFIDSGDVSATDFDLSDAQAADLVARGERFTRAYFHWFDDPSNKPINRV